MCKYKQPLDLIGKVCYECGEPATKWRTHKLPIRPWCNECWIKSSLEEEGEIIIRKLPKRDEV